jgi:transcriptional regulator with XRE-family HTH domain
MSMPVTQQNGLGARLRALRKARRLSLSEVAEKTQISTSFLSLVENGKSDITIGRLTRLVEFYGVAIADLLPAPPPAESHIIRHDELRLLHSPAEGIDVYLLVGDTSQTMMPMFLEFKPGAGLAEYGSHLGEEFVYVLEGELALEVGNGEPKLLRPGDSAYYRADQPHLFRNASETAPLKLVCVDSPPTF